MLKSLNTLTKLPGSKKLGSILKLLFAYIALCGLSMFPNFILEEAFQTAMFGSWPAQDAKDWNLVLKGCDLMRRINKTLKIINYGFGWIQPLAFLSYRAYSHSADYYVDALERKTFAYSPETFVGRKIEFIFVPDEIINDKQGVRLISNRIQVITDTIPESRRVVVSGRVEMRGGRVVIVAEKVEEVE